MKIRVLYNCRWLPGDVLGMTIYPFIFIALPESVTPDRLLSHELVHVDQVRRVGWLRFYSSYIWYWLRGLKNGTESAYQNNPWEVEAYQAERLVLSKTERATLGI